MISRKKCPTCLRKVQSFCYKISCSLCRNVYHANCISWSHNDIVFNRDSWFCNNCLNNELPFHHIEEENEFQAVITESRLGFPALYQNFDELVFNPFEINDDTSSPLDEIDPDFQFFTSSQYLEGTKCDYYLEDSFISKISSNTLYEGQLSLYHMNCRSLPKHFDSIQLYLDSLSFKFPFIGFSETRITEAKEDLYNLDGYFPIHEYREHRSGGGVSLFVQNDVPFTRRADLEYFDSEMESIYIEFDKSVFSTKSNVILALIYRMPDSNVETFTERMDNTLNTIIRKEKKLFYLMGDINVCLLKSDSHRASTAMLDMFYSYNVFPIIGKPTRVTRDTATVIDHIWTNNMTIESDHVQGILCSTISDHFSIFHIAVNTKQLDTNDYTPVLRRSFTQNNLNKFKDQLRSINWNSILIENDPQIAYTSFHNVISKLYNTCFPLRPTPKKYYNNKPWLTAAMKEAIKYKNKLFVDRFNGGDFAEKDKCYKKYRNKLHHELRTAERNHYKELLSKHKSNLRKTWSVIKQVINKNKYRPGCKKFVHNGKIIDDGQVIANKFNDFYVNIGSSLARKIPKTSKCPYDYMTNCNNQSAKFVSTEVNEDHVLKIISDFGDSAAGWDDLKPNVIKHVKLYISKPLAHITNLSFKNSVFPHELKKANVVPIFKKDDKMAFSNYRPVSVLPVFSKIIERLMYNRLFDYINENKLLYKYQFGFQKGKSTNMALILLVDKITEALERGEVVLGVFLDFSKAFDTVDHHILLEKLRLYGITGIENEWFRNYLCNRQQFVTYNGFRSSSQAIGCGVPQGSILGPLLFLLYINDLSAVSNDIFSILFADDSNLFISGKDVDSLSAKMNNVLKDVQEWLCSNKLSLNVLKTHYMIFTNKRTIVKDIKLVVFNYEIERAYVTKFLGVQIDSKLTWSEHIAYTCKKLAKSAAVLSKARIKLPKSCLVSLYYSVAYPYFIYCNHVWGNTHTTFLDPLLKCQKRIIRIITSSPYRAHTRPLLVANNMLNVFDINNLVVSVFMRTALYSIEPSNIFSSFFTMKNAVHDHETRSRHDVYIPLAKKFVRGLSIRFHGGKVWNDIPDHIRDSETSDSFKINLKKFYIERQILISSES